MRKQLRTTSLLTWLDSSPSACIGEELRAGRAGSTLDGAVKARSDGESGKSDADFEVAALCLLFFSGRLNTGETALLQAVAIVARKTVHETRPRLRGNLPKASPQATR